MRSGRWFGDSDTDRTLGLLRDHGLNYVSVDEPQGFPSSVPPLAVATGNIGVVRFHGRNAETWQKKNTTAAERFNYDYSADELKEWLPRIEQLAEQSREVHLLMNNCYQDKAVNDARELGHHGDITVGALARRLAVPERPRGNRQRGADNAQRLDDAEDAGRCDGADADEPHVASEDLRRRHLGDRLPV